MTASSLTHFDAAGQAHMVDVAGKADTHRVALAAGTIRMQPATLELIRAGDAKKGDVIGIARIAAIQGAKRTAELIPLCHPIAITRIAVDFELDDPAQPAHGPAGALASSVGAAVGSAAGATADPDASSAPAAAVRCTARVECTGKTGVEMEALTAVQVGLLTIYDMCKAADRGMTITDVRLLEKRGGKSGDWTAGR